MKDKIASLFYKYAENSDFSGAALVKQGDNILFEYSQGYAHRGFKIANTPRTMFDTASITKIFTATAILILVNQGKLKLKDKIHDILDLSNTEIPKDIEITHLLTHTSGIADDAEEENGEDYSDLFKNSPNYAIRNNADFIPNFACKKPNFKAGTNVRYNNCAFVLLGLAIEKVTGQRYREFVKENIFKAFGMEDSKFCAKDYGDGNMAEGYFKGTDDAGQEAWVKNIYSYPPIGTGDAGAYTTVYDLDKFIRKLKSIPELHEIFTPHCEFSRKFDWSEDKAGLIKFGYAFEFIELHGELFAMYKDGCNLGVVAKFAYYPKYDISFTILGNQDFNIWDIHKRVEEVIYDFDKLG